jgi:hypothetical protein
VLLLASRDRERAGKLEEIAVGVVDSSYEAYLLYEPLDSFLAGEQPGTTPAPVVPLHPAAGAETPKVTLKQTVVPFVPPEAPADDESGEKAAGGRDGPHKP